MLRPPRGAKNATEKSPSLSVLESAAGVTRHSRRSVYASHRARPGSAVPCSLPHAPFLTVHRFLTEAFDEMSTRRVLCSPFGSLIHWPPPLPSLFVIHPAETIPSLDLSLQILHTPICS